MRPGEPVLDQLLRLLVEDFGPVLCFRDPDDIQLELFAMEPADPAG
ncbi:hypothetical protein OHR68_25950 [Spirillospora sp. NBC_00431]